MIRSLFRGELHLQKRIPSFQPFVFILIAALSVSTLIAITRKDIAISIDGDVKRVATFSQDVAGVLEETGIIIGENDLLFPAVTETVTEGMEITIKRAFPVTVHADGKIHEVYAAQAIVGDILQKLHVTLGELDRVEPVQDHLVTRGESIQVIRVERRVITQRTEIPFREERRGNGTLDRGVSRLMIKGVKGLREDTVEIMLENGVEVSTTILRSELLRVKQDQVVEYGENTVLSRGGRRMQFVRVYTVSATAYCAGTAGTGCPINSYGHSACTGKYNSGRTATGQAAIAGNGSETHPHLVSVDSRVFPLGSRFYIDGYGFAVAADTGGAIRGNRIDLLLPTHEAALRFGRRQLRVYLLQ